MKKSGKKVTALLMVGISLLFIMACGSEKEKKVETDVQQVESENKEVDALADPMQVKGVGPVQQITLEPTINKQMAAEGKEIFEQYCTVCHKINERYIGPPVKGVTTRRSPEWIMNMILNPEEMVKQDPIAKELLQEYVSPMANQGLTQEQARKILEYFRTLTEVDSLNHKS